MKVLEPRVAAELAEEVYDVQSELFVAGFLSRQEFSSKSDQKLSLKANIGFRTMSVTDGFGICAVGGVGYEDDVFLIFRGSTFANDNADWFSNARIGLEFSTTGLPVHIGFNQIFCSMLPELEMFMAENQQRGTVHCIGHSLGGAVATLAADWVSKYFANPVRLYTFGAPRPAMMLFAHRFSHRIQTKNIFRTFHTTDPVPMVPLFPFTQPPLPGYGHCIPSSEPIASAAAHDMGKYVKSVQNASWPELERRKPPYSAESIIEQWLESKLPVNPVDPTILERINASLIYVLKKAGGAFFESIQLGITGVVTLADKLAWVLMQGIQLLDSVKQLVINLLKKITQFLSLASLKVDADITQVYIRDILWQLMSKMNQDAAYAMQRHYHS